MDDQGKAASVTETDEQKGIKRDVLGFDFLAKRDHLIVCNDERYDLKKGEKYTLPRRWEPTLRTEGVI